MNFGRFAGFLMTVGTVLLIWGYLLFSSVDAHSFAGSFYESEHREADLLRSERASLGGWSSSDNEYRQMRVNDQQGARRENGKYMLIAGGSLFVLGLGILMSVSKPGPATPDASEETKS